MDENDTTIMVTQSDDGTELTIFIKSHDTVDPDEMIKLLNTFDIKGAMMENKLVTHEGPKEIM